MNIRRYSFKYIVRGYDVIKCNMYIYFFIYNI